MNDRLMAANTVGELHDHAHYERESCKSEPPCQPLHKLGDWLLIACYDNNTGEFTCQHCPKTGIRYEHELRHKELCECGLTLNQHLDAVIPAADCDFKAWTIRVGCVCAEKLTGDSTTPREHEKALKSRMRQKKAFLSYWKTSQKGNLYRKWLWEGKEYVIVLDRVHFSNHWRYSWKLTDAGEWHKSKEYYESDDQAKSASFEELFPPVIGVMHRVSA